MRMKWNVEGYQGYHRIRPNIENFIRNTIEQEKIQNRLLIAITEGICNAAKYGKFGPAHTRISIALQVDKIIDRNLFMLMIKADTNKFNIFKQYKKMYDAAKNKNYWYENTENDIAGRGLWLMLGGVDLLSYSSDAKELVLLKLFPAVNEQHEDKTAKELLTRFVI